MLDIKIIIVAAALATIISGCATQPQFIGDHTRSHPATQKYLSYSDSVEDSSDFMQLLDFFAPSRHKQIKDSKGWYRLVYSASYNGLKNGRCDSIQLTIQGSRKSRIDCKGPFTWRSASLGDQEEKMHLRVNLEKKHGEWWIYNSGLVHTQVKGIYGEIVERGLKFKSDVLDGIDIQEPPPLPNRNR